MRVHVPVCTYTCIYMHLKYVYIVPVCVGECSFFVVQLVRGMEVVLGEGSGCSVETRLDTRERFIPLLLDKYKVREGCKRNRQREEMKEIQCTYLIFIATIPGVHSPGVEKQLSKGIGKICWRTYQLHNRSSCIAEHFYL